MTIVQMQEFAKRINPRTPTVFARYIEIAQFLGVIVSHLEERLHQKYEVPTVAQQTSCVRFAGTEDYHRKTSVHRAGYTHSSFGIQICVETVTHVGFA